MSDPTKGYCESCGEVPLLLRNTTQTMDTNKIREALELAEAMADVFDQLSQKFGDLRERNADRSRLEEIREAIAELDKFVSSQQLTQLNDEQPRERC